MKALVPLVTAMGASSTAAERWLASRNETPKDKTPYSSPALPATFWIAPYLLSSIQETEFTFWQCLMGKQKWELFTTLDFYQSITLTETVKCVLITIMFILNISDIIIIKIMPLRIWNNRVTNRLKFPCIGI